MIEIYSIYLKPLNVHILFVQTKQTVIFCDLDVYLDNTAPMHASRSLRS